MKTKSLAGFAVLAVLALGFAGTVRCESRHFQASQRHFDEMASTASLLSEQMELAADRNFCSFLAATALAYAIRAHVMAQLASIAEAVRDPGDRQTVAGKLDESRKFTTMYVEHDLKIIEGLAATSENSKVRRLGMRMLNELRVFENNASTIQIK